MSGCVRLVITVAILTCAVIAPVSLVTAEDGTGATASIPQGPGPAILPGAAPPAMGPNSPMLSAPGPAGVWRASPVRGEGAGVPLPTNLGGEVGTLGPYALGRDDVVYID